MSEIKDFLAGVGKVTLYYFPRASSLITIWEEFKFGEYKRRMDDFKESIESRLDLLMQISSHSSE